MADQVLKHGVSGISDLVAVPGLINLDLADVRRIMTQAGVCHMGIGRASGEGRATSAIRQAINSPLLDTTIDGARGVIINFTGGRDMKIREIDEAASVVRDAVSPEADIIFGAVIDPLMSDEIMITVIASGFDRDNSAVAPKPAISQATGRTVPFGQNQASAQPSDLPVRAAPDVAAIPDFLSSAMQRPANPVDFPQASSTGFHHVGQLSEEPDLKPKVSPAYPSFDRAGKEIPSPAPAAAASFVPAGEAAVSAASAPKDIPRENARKAGEPPARHEKKSGRILPWFLQDNDSRTGENRE
jgi:cell division protein FtsZ